MTLVLLVLAVVWAAVLIPPALRARQEGRPGDSISNFRRQLAVLRRTDPSESRSQYRRHDRVSAYNSPAATSLASVRNLHSPTNSNGHASNGHASNGASNGVAARSRSGSAARSRTLRRRRDVLGALAAAVVISLVLAIAFAFATPFLVAHLVADALLALYVVLLVHQRNAAAEREMKIRFLPTAPFDPTALHGDLALLRRSAN